MSRPRHPLIVVRLADADRNPFVVIGEVRYALRDAGIDPTEFIVAAVRSDYAGLLEIARSWVTVVGVETSTRTRSRVPPSH
jgi:hypothetical protein